MELTADFVSRCVRNVEANTTVASSLELLQALIAALPPVEDEFRPNTRDAVLADAEDDFALTSLIVANTCTFMRDARAELIVKRKLAPSEGECWKAGYRYVSCESFSQCDSLPFIYTASPRLCGERSLHRARQPSHGVSNGDRRPPRLPCLRGAQLGIALYVRAARGPLERTRRRRTLAKRTRELL